MSTECKHCGLSITRVNYAMGPRWMHNPPGRQEMNGGPYSVFEYCESSVAEPISEPGTNP